MSTNPYGNSLFLKEILNSFFQGMTMRKILALLLFGTILGGCAGQRVSSDDPINRALKLCGLGIDTKSADVYKAAVDFANKKGSVSFGSEVSEAVDTQIGILLKQTDLKSDTGRKDVVDEIQRTRQCVISQVELARPLKKAELLEQCRVDVQRKISPPGNTSSGTLRNWNQASGSFSDSEIVTMTGLFDTRGSSSFWLKAQCDLRGGTFNEAVIQQSSN
ncbi:hypothetical protein [Janthinobacterium lividum]|uniref:hypothetical protein n=1 Tax=Janthinobacterium lividum TaxID=29581 RepID=UPI00140B6E76|nr:hypothetical protein [Janthinobacterium lividum]NHQ89496.1 hypothetical protein [Janthinobacterium lividum]